jgi:hypothetical protein
LGFYLWLKDDQLLYVLIRSFTAGVRRDEMLDSDLDGGFNHVFLILRYSRVKGFDNGVLFFEGCCKRGL